MAQSIVLSAPRPAPSFTPMFIAIDRGFLADEGLDATIKYNVGAEALVRGETDFLGTGGGLSAFLEGADIRLICGHSTQGGAHVLVARSQFQSVRELKEITVAAEQNVTELRTILEREGIDLDKSGIKTIHIKGSHPKQYEALKRGVGDGAMLGAPWWIFAVKEGYRNMGSGAQPGAGLSTIALFTSARKIAEQPAVVRSFVRAYVKSIQYARENMQGTIETMKKYSGEWGVDNDEIARQVYDLFAPDWSPDVDLKAVERLLKTTSQKMGRPPTPAEKFVDLRFLQEALRPAA